MKKVLFLAFIAFTWYLAGMYRLASMMVLAIMELLFFLGMFFLCQYFKKHLQAGFRDSAQTAYQGIKAPCPIQATNSGKLPVSRFRIHVHCAYPWEDRGTKTAFIGSLDRRSTDNLQFYLEAPWCGLLTLSIEKADVFDYLSLFRARIALKSQMQIAVLPPKQAMHIAFGAGAVAEYSGFEPEVHPLAGNDYEEIRQLREYLPGDPYRLIHWNQSARTDTLWVKEYSQDRDEHVSLYLDFQSETEPTVQGIDAFFHLLSALILGLLQEKSLVHVRWGQPDGFLAEMPVQDAQDCDGLLIRLYGEDLTKRPEALVPSVGASDFCLDLELKLSWNGKMLFQFHPETFETELEQTVLHVS